MEVLTAAGQGLAWGGLGIMLLLLGYLMVDLLTPGPLGEQVFTQRNRNAAMIVSSGMAANAAIVTTAILTSRDAFLVGLLSAALWGVIGIVLLAIAFLVIDFFAPGDLRTLVVSPEPHPAAWVTATAHLAMGAIVAAAIS